MTCLASFATWTALAGLLLGAAGCLAQPAEPLVRLDHLPVAVRDLNQAVAEFQAQGFAIKPGRTHANGLRNAHIKFANGAGLELMAVDQSRDELSAHYLEFLRVGEGPAFLSLHADSEERVAQALTAAAVGHSRNPGGLELTDPKLDWVFFAGDNRSPTDLPHHFAHRNGAFATREVWVALDDAAPLARLLTALGARERHEVLREPIASQAVVFELSEKGRIVVLPARFQWVKGHPLIGVVLAARGESAQKAMRLAPHQSHGLWLELRPEP